MFQLISHSSFQSVHLLPMPNVWFTQNVIDRYFAWLAFTFFLPAQNPPNPSHHLLLSHLTMAPSKKYTYSYLCGCKYLTNRKNNLLKHISTGTNTGDKGQDTWWVHAEHIENTDNMCLRYAQWLNIHWVFWPLSPVQPAEQISNGTSKSALGGGNLQKDWVGGADCRHTYLTQVPLCNDWGDLWHV